MIARPLTDRQQAILDFIVETIQTRGFPPTLREIGRAFGIRSTKGVNDHLAALERKGKIRRHADLSRGIEVVDLRLLPDVLTLGWGELRHRLNARGASRSNPGGEAR